jgi:hypothetical protein
MGELGGIDIFTKTTGGWQIVALIYHDPSKVLGCSD